MSEAKNIVVLVSGGGSNLQALIDGCANGSINANIANVICNRPGAYGLQRASDAGIPHQCIDHTEYESREAFDLALADAIDGPANNQAADLVVLAGFMRILTPAFVSKFEGRLLNIHPSLLPKYPGLNTHQRALDAGDKEAGVTVHFVTAELDGGPPIVQARVDIVEGDDASSLASRVLQQEHHIYPLAVSWFVEDRLSLIDGKAILDDEILPPNGVDFAGEHAVG